MRQINTPSGVLIEVEDRVNQSNSTFKYTEFDERGNWISAIQYCGEEKTLSGVGIGSTRADIEAAYGIDYLMDPNFIIYTYGENEKLSFRMNGEKCERIELYCE